MNEYDEIVARIVAVCVGVVVGLLVLGLTVTNIWGAIQHSYDFAACLDKGGSWVVDYGEPDSSVDDHELCQLPDANDPDSVGATK